MKRREFLLELLAAPVSAGLASGTPDCRPGAPRLPDPRQSGVDHIVVVTLENRSFDHVLGWLPNSDGKQEGLEYADSSGLTHSTYPLAPDYTGSAHQDPDHSYEGGRIEYDHGAADGWLRVSDLYSIGYYTGEDLPFLASLARNYTTLDRYFCSVLGPTFPNRIFQYAAQTDRIANSLSICPLRTIFDSLAEAGIGAGYYYGNFPFLSLWGAKYQPISHPFAEFSAAAASGTLPPVAFIDPSYTALTPGNDDHPPADVRNGDAFMEEVFRAARGSPLWSRMVLIFNFDEWGGFFDHVAPPRVVAGNGVDPDLAGGKALLGFRVPAVIASPFSGGDPANPRVNRLLFDHTSVLKLIEWRWGLEPLSPRDGSVDVHNLALALDFSGRGHS